MLEVDVLVVVVVVVAVDPVVDVCHCVEDGERHAGEHQGDKLKEEAKTQEARVKALEAKVKAEVDAHEQTRESLNTTFKQLCELQVTAT